MKLLIEGIKLTGKSSLITSLNKIDRETSIFEFRSHCLIGAEKRYTLHKDIDKTLLSYSQFLKNISSYAHFLLLRGHIFAYATARITNQSINAEFEFIDSFFSEIGLKIILLRIDRETFYSRLEEREKAG